MPQPSLSFAPPPGQKRAQLQHYYSPVHGDQGGGYRGNLGKRQEQQPEGIECTLKQLTRKRGEVHSSEGVEEDSTALATLASVSMSPSVASGRPGAPIPTSPAASSPSPSHQNIVLGPCHFQMKSSASDELPHPSKRKRRRSSDFGGNSTEGTMMETVSLLEENRNLRQHCQNLTDGYHQLELRLQRAELELKEKHNLLSKYRSNLVSFFEQGCVDNIERDATCPSTARRVEAEPPARTEVTKERVYWDNNGASKKVQELAIDERVNRPQEGESNVQSAHSNLRALANRKLHNAPPDELEKERRALPFPPPPPRSRSSQLPQPVVVENGSLKSKPPEAQEAPAPNGSAVRSDEEDASGDTESENDASDSDSSLPITQSLPRADVPSMVSGTGRRKYRRRKPSVWTPKEEASFMNAYNIHGCRWKSIQEMLPHKTRQQIQSHGSYLIKQGRIKKFNSRRWRRRKRDANGKIIASETDDEDGEDSECSGSASPIEGDEQDGEADYSADHEGKESDLQDDVHEKKRSEIIWLKDVKPAWRTDVETIKPITEAEIVAREHSTQNKTDADMV